MGAIEAVLYGKPDCHLCHEAEDTLVRLAAEYDLRLTITNILDDPQLETRYRYEIPVIILNGRIELSAPILESELRVALARLA